MQGKVYLRVLKNTLMKLAIEELKKEDLKKLEGYLEGSNVYLFTDLNPFKLALLLDRGKVKTTAKAGDTAAYGRGCSSGQHWSTSRSNYQPAEQRRFAYPYRVRQRLGQQRHACCTQGEEINEHLAGVLSKLNIKSVELGISMRVGLRQRVQLSSATNSK